MSGDWAVGLASHTWLAETHIQFIAPFIMEINYYIHYYINYYYTVEEPFFEETLIVPFLLLDKTKKVLYRFQQKNWQKCQIMIFLFGSFFYNGEQYMLTFQ